MKKQNRQPSLRERFEQSDWGPRIWWDTCGSFALLAILVVAVLKILFGATTLHPLRLLFRMITRPRERVKRMMLNAWCRLWDHTWSESDLYDSKCARCGVRLSEVEDELGLFLKVKFGKFVPISKGDDFDVSE